jgi:hypothetical protein
MPERSGGSSSSDRAGDLRAGLSLVDDGRVGQAALAIAD